MQHSHLLFMFVHKIRVFVCFAQLSRINNIRYVILSVKHSKSNKLIRKLQVVRLVFGTKQNILINRCEECHSIHIRLNRRYEISTYPNVPIHNVNDRVTDNRMNWTFFIHLSLARLSPFLLNETSSLLCCAVPCRALHCMCVCLHSSFVCTKVFRCVRETCSKYTTYLARA